MGAVVRHTVRTMTETTLLFADGLDLVSAQVDSTDAEVWQNPSPCAGWRAVDVLAHVTRHRAQGAELPRWR